MQSLLSFVPLILRFMGGRSSKTKVVTHTVEKVITKVVNMQQEHYEKDQKLLEAFLNKHYAVVAACEKVVSMTIGESGSGKSTSLKLFWKVDSTTGMGLKDVTQEFTPIFSTFRNVLVVDTVGFLPSLANIGKLFVVLFYRELMPDWLVYIANNDRIVDVLTLKNFIDSGLVKAGKHFIKYQ